MTKHLFLLTLFSIGTLCICAQTVNTTSSIEQNTTDSIPAQDDNHMIMFGLSYSTNNTDNKNFLDIKMPTITGDIYFFAKNGIWSSFAYSNYIDASSNTYETELSLGYQHYFFDILDIDLSYKWHQFKGDTLYSGIDYEHGLQLSTGLDFDFIDFYMDNTMLFGASNNYFLDFSLSFNLDKDALLFKSDNLSFSPTLMASFGTNDFIYLDIIPRQIRRRGQIINLPPQIIENAESEFIYQNLAVFVPLIYTIDNLSFTFAWAYSMPSTKLKEFSWTNQSSIFLSLTYMPNIFK